MSSSVINVYNLALAKLGGNKVYGVNAPEEDSAQARLCNLFYPGVRKGSLEAFAWSFALGRVALAYLGEGDAEYARRYQMPSDCLNPVKIAGGSEDGPKYRVFAGELWTSAQAPILEYVRDIEDVGQFPQYFINILATALAAEIARPLRNEAAIEQSLRSELLSLIGEAQTSDKSRSDPNRAVAEWVETRG